MNSDRSRTDPCSHQDRSRIDPFKISNQSVEFQRKSSERLVIKCSQTFFLQSTLKSFALRSFCFESIFLIFALGFFRGSHPPSLSPKKSQSVQEQTVCSEHFKRPLTGSCSTESTGTVHLVLSKLSEIKMENNLKLCNQLVKIDLLL